MRTSVDFLVNRLSYLVPQQDLRIDYRLPALPRGRFLLAHVRLLAAGGRTGSAPGRVAWAS